MSSEAVRNAVFTTVAAAAAPLAVYDMSDYDEIETLVTSLTDTIVLLQYVVADEQQMNIAGEGNQGWEESGAANIHLLTPVGFDSLPAIQAGDAIKNAVRGTRVGSVVLDSCTPFADFGGGSIGVEGAFKSFTASLYYYNRDCG